MADISKQNPDKNAIRRDAPSQALDTTNRPSQIARERGNRYDSPFSFMRRFMSDVDQLFGNYWGWTGFGGSQLWMPQTDVFEKDGQLIVHADLPGTLENDIKVRVDDGVLVISGERTSQYDRDDRDLYVRERGFGTFTRSIALPDGVDPESIHASFDNGVLEVRVPLPKTVAAKSHDVPLRKSAPTDVKH